MTAKPSSIAAERRLAALSVAWCINAFAYAIAYPFLPIYLHSERQFPMREVGSMYLIMGIARMLAPAVSGPLVDRFGRRLILIAAPAVRGLAYFAFAAAVYADANFWTLAGLLFLVMFLGGFFQNATDAYVTDITPPAQRADAFSRLRVAFNLGCTAGPAVGAFLARTPFALLFAITGALCLLTPLVVGFFCPEPERYEPKEESESFVAVLSRDRVFLFLLAAAFPLFIVSSQLITTLSVYAKEHVRLSSAAIGCLYTLNGLLVIAFQMPLSRAVERRHFAWRAAVGALFYALGYFSAAFCNHAWQMLLAVTVSVSYTHL
ncbi:MAG: MFS transporter, partial [Planctomycetota bacterium]|nr:MFS transporter [Planctomycetota bacterium]